MERLRGRFGLTLGPILLLVFWSGGCSRPTGIPGDAHAAPASRHDVPFQGDKGAPNSDDGTGALDSEPVGDGASLPFRDPEHLPIGTLLTVRLKNPISSGNPETSGTFDAVVDKAVMIGGMTLIPSGTSVAGRVESVRTSSIKHSHGYIRLTLASIDVAGRELPVQTASLFARGKTVDTMIGEDRSIIISLESGRQLTFRLTEPVYLASQQTAPGH